MLVTVKGQSWHSNLLSHAGQSGLDWGHGAPCVLVLLMVVNFLTQD